LPARLAASCTGRGAIRAIGRFQGAMVGKEHFEGDVEGLVVPSVLDESCTEGSFQCGAVTEIDELDGFHCIDGFDHRNRDACRPQLSDEVG
jgi:hypothetical protein